MTDVLLEATARETTEVVREVLARARQRERRRRRAGRRPNAGAAPEQSPLCMQCADRRSSLQCLFNRSLNYCTSAVVAACRCQGYTVLLFVTCTVQYITVEYF